MQSDVKDALQPRIIDHWQLHLPGENFGKCVHAGVVRLDDHAGIAGCCAGPGFAGLGLLLAALGIYGVISYTVTRQTQEIGIRMALGASASIVERQVLVSTLRLALIGVFLGAFASLATAKLIASLLFATSPWDGATYLAMAAALLAVAALSGYIPARRASRISPMVALRAN